MHHNRLYRGAMAALLLCASAAIVTWPASAGASSLAHSARAHLVTQVPCTTPVCVFSLGVDPKLTTGAFTCPAIANARAQIAITNRFANGALNDTMTLTASGLPPNTGFDMFLVQNSPLDAGAFAGFGFGWYQSDVQSDAFGRANVTVRGIFDKETFIENPSANNGFAPVHIFNVGFWFNSPAEEQHVCGNKTTPPTTPFNGEQNAGLLAMITQGEPLRFVQ